MGPKWAFAVVREKGRAESETPRGAGVRSLDSPAKESASARGEDATSRVRASVAAAIAVGAFKAKAAEQQGAPDPSSAPATPSSKANPGAPSSSPRRASRRRGAFTTTNHNSITQNGAPSPLLLLQPCLEPDPEFPDFEAVVAEEARARRQPRLARARACYRRVARQEPPRYKDLVNLAACHQLLGQPAMALPLLKQATQLEPDRPTAHVNQVLCTTLMGDLFAAAAAVRRTVADATGLSDAQNELLQRCKVVIYGKSKKEKGAGDVGVGAASEAFAAEGLSDPATMEKLRAGLRSLRSSADEARPSTPPWGRIHSYADDHQANVAKDLGERAKWQPLLPDQLAVLRRNLGVHELGSFEREECAKFAYKAANSLSFLRRVPAEQAVSVLAAADYVELEDQEYLFRQGDDVDFMYIIASGSVRVEVFMEACGCAVAVDTLFDGQLFGEQAAACNSAGSNKRRASIVAQEHTFLVRLLPVDYRRIMGAPESSGSTTINGLSPEELVLQSKSIDRRASAQRRAMPDHIRLRLDVLKRWPHLVGASDYALAILASNVQEVQLRHGDEFVHVGQTLEGCFLLLEGVCKVFIRPEDVEEDDETAGAPESARLCGHISWRELGHRRRRDSGQEPGAGGPYPPGADGHPAVSTARRGLTPRAPDNRSAGRPSYSPRPPSRGEMRTGVPKVGRPWETTLRVERPPEILATPTSEELLLRSLHAGQAFGLSALTKPPGELAQSADARVRIDSCTARLIVLTRHSLLYLPAAVASSLLARLKAAEDPVRPPRELLRDARRHHISWAVKRERVLRAQLTTSA